MNRSSRVWWGCNLSQQNTPLIILHFHLLWFAKTPLSSNKSKITWTNNYGVTDIGQQPYEPYTHATHHNDETQIRIWAWIFIEAKSSIFTKHLNAISSSKLAELGETPKNRVLNVRLLVLSSKSSTSAWEKLEEVQRTPESLRPAYNQVLCLIHCTSIFWWQALNMDSVGSTINRTSPITLEMMACTILYYRLMISASVAWQNYSLNQNRSSDPSLFGSSLSAH